MKNIDIVFKLLGSEYSIKIIDHERVIYRKLNNDIEIEISGLDNYRKVYLRAFIFIWKDGETILRTPEIKTIEDVVVETKKRIINYKLGVFDQCTSKI